MPRINSLGMGMILCLSLTLFVSGCPQEKFSSMKSTSFSKSPAKSNTDTNPSGSEHERLRDKHVKPLKLLSWTGKFSDEWKKYDKFLYEQKYEAATKLVDKLLKKSREEHDPEQWVLCLIRKVMLRISLHGYETAVGYFTEQTWPDDLLSTTVLNLYYADTLISYAQNYSWEIRKREKIDTAAKVDLKLWTMGQIFQEALETYAKIWPYRVQLGTEPIDHLSGFVKKNDYPRNIRSSLRDFLTYQLANLLADTSYWRPEHTNGVYQLDLGKLLGHLDLSLVQLKDPSIHPLIKICAVLDDLESWHETNKEAEAALEARMTRLRILHTKFTKTEDRQRIKHDLLSHLEPVRKLPWWAVGQALLAQCIKQQEDTPDNLVRARAIALECQKAFPESIGGQRCLNIKESIDAHDYNIQAMSTDSPGKESILVNYRNLKKIYFRAYPIDLKKHIESSHDYSLFSEYRALNQILKKSRPSNKWSIKLQPTPDYKMHKQYVTPPMKKEGFYVVMASAFEDFRKSDNKITAISMIIGDLVLVSQNEGDRLKVTMISGASGKTISGVKVHLYCYNWNTGNKSVAMKVTGKDGEVTFRRPSFRQYFLFANKGKQVAMNPDYIFMDKAPKPREYSSTLIYTDRTIYRPMQKIKFKTLLYRGRHDLGNYRTLPKSKVTISLIDANYKKVASKTLVTNSFGTASGEFTIPAGRLLGNWRLHTSPPGSAYLKVEEYKRPTFEVKLLESKDPLRLNKPTKIKGQSRYYFGLPLTGAKVNWRVVRTPVYPWWWSYYYYGQRQSGAREVVATGIATTSKEGTFEIEFIPKADEHLANTSKYLSYRYNVSVDVTNEGGETRSAKRGFRLGFVALEASVVMNTNFFIEGQKSELTIIRTNLDGNPAPGKGKWSLVELKMPIKTILPADQPLVSAPGEKLDGFVTSGDRKRARWNTNYNPEAAIRQWADGPEKSSGETVSDKEGKAVLHLPPLKAGAYRLRYTTTDAFGAKYEMSKEFLVAAKQTDIHLPALFKVERNSVKVGQSVKIFLVSGLKGQTIFFETYKDSKRISRKLFISDNSPTLIEIPVTEKDRGGFGLSFWLVNDHQFINFNQSVFVPWDNKKLKVHFSTFRDKLRPGQKERWKITVTAPSEKDSLIANAELLAYMYDRSLDSFAPHTYPSVLDLYPNHSTFAWTNTNISMAHISYARTDGWRAPAEYPILQNDYPKFIAGYGIGGPGRRGVLRYKRRSLRASVPISPGASGLKISDKANDEMRPLKEQKGTTATLETLSQKQVGQGYGSDGASASPDKNRDKEPQNNNKQNPVEIREDFSETAFFLPHLLTHEDGSASVEFSVPDSVTSWNVYVHAITRDLKSGTLQKEVKTMKDLMVRPYLPRFLREGDKAVIKVVVNNASSHDLKGSIDLDIVDPDTKKSLLVDFGLTKAKATGIGFFVKPEAGSSVSFYIKTPLRIGLAAFRVTATSSDFSDGELRPIPILPARMHFSQSRFVTLKNKDQRVMSFEDMKKMTTLPSCRSRWWLPSTRSCSTQC